MHDVTVLHDIVFALKSQLAGIARACLTAASDVIVVGDGLGTNKTPLEIGMNDARGLRRLGAMRYRPGAGSPSVLP